MNIASQKRLSENGPQRAPRGTKPQKPLSPTGYLIAVLKLREGLPPREAKLLNRVPEARQDEARAMLARQDAR